MLRKKFVLGLMVLGLVWGVEGVEEAHRRIKTMCKKELRLKKRIGLWVLAVAMGIGMLANFGYAIG
jgi:hypothetical protein